MTANKILLNLNAEEVIKLTMILLDQDKEEALKFLKGVLKPQVEQTM